MALVSGSESALGPENPPNWVRERNPTGKFRLRSIPPGKSSEYRPSPSLSIPSRPSSLYCVSPRPRTIRPSFEVNPPTIYGDGQQSRDFVFVGDVARANLLAATVPDIAGERFNIARGEQTTLLELLTNLRTILGQDIEPIHEPPRAGDVRDSLADINQARSRLMFEPTVTIEEGLRLSVDYYRSLVETSAV